MRYELFAAIALSPGNKALTRKDGILYVVEERPGIYDQKKRSFYSFFRVSMIDAQGYLQMNETPLLFYQFLELLAEHGLDPDAIIWKAIGFGEE